jgi:hypothetical protein
MERSHIQQSNQCFQLDLGISYFQGHSDKVERDILDQIKIFMQ